jgi:hypothetical protein
MKITDLAIVFCMIFAAVSLSIDISQKKMIEAEEIRARYNEIIFAATQDATLAMKDNPKDDAAINILSGRNISANSTTDTNVATEDATTENNIDVITTNSIKMDDITDLRVKPNLDAALDRFYKTIYVNMNIQHDKVAQDAMKVHMPVQIVVANDGYYVHAWEEGININGTGKSEIFEEWLPKKYYSYYSGYLIINFTLDDNVFIYNTVSGKSWTGCVRDIPRDTSINYRDQKIFEDFYTGYDALSSAAVQTDAIKAYDKSFSFNGDKFMNSTFDLQRRLTIVSGIKRDLEYYSMKYNSAAKAYNTGYSFNIPEISKDEWNSTTDHIGFLAFFQGLVIGNGQYNTYGFGGTKLTQVEKYVGTTNVDGLMEYHRMSCKLLKTDKPMASGKIDYEGLRTSGRYSDVRLFTTKVEGSRKGYLPCPECQP